MRVPWELWLGAWLWLVACSPPDESRGLAREPVAAPAVGPQTAAPTFPPAEVVPQNDGRAPAGEGRLTADEMRQMGELGFMPALLQSLDAYDHSGDCDLGDPFSSCQ